MAVKQNILGVAATVLLGLVACTDGRDAAQIEDGLSAIKRGDALYAAAKYKEAFDSYHVAGNAFNGKDSLLLSAAAARADKAFCMEQFTGARRDLAAGDRMLALLQIDTALGTPACNAFEEEMIWAREQKNLQKPF